MGNPVGRPRKVDAEERCPRCGEYMTRQGWNYTKRSKFQRYRCPKCAFITSAPIGVKAVQKLDKILKGKVLLK